ncbi:DNA polymerase IV [Spiroplasma helicoides]|uniref:DNA polymerase IV n=1 Tax=Spiroplasma helicoides TaxID=216938 RepID=A0A1B3SKQ6_9MOLU|nr:DNA polymerase IV [Spiroplasma helicoides]AOG60514.1 DNA polymerase IV [Spiroplasma helicoides]
MKENKVIFLLDMDAFFAHCHMAKDSSLKDKVLVVATPNRRAIISTASYNARSYGIKSGMPLFKAKELCKDVYPVDSDFALYIGYSQKVFDIIYNNFSKKIEVASIDECYIDATNKWQKFGSVKKCAIFLKNLVFEKTGLTCSIGISSNKFLAKSCVDFNKPNGVSILLPSEIEKKLWHLPIKDMYMIGSSTEKILKNNNINLIGDLAKSSLEKILDLIGKRGLTLWNWANGRGNDVVEEEKNELKSIGNEFTLNYTTSDTEEIEEMIYELSCKVSDRSKKRFLKSKTITTIIRYERNTKQDFDPKIHRKTVSNQTSIDKWTDEVEIIYSLAKENFYRIWNGEPISLIGVRLSNIIDSINAKDQLTINQINLSESFLLNKKEKVLGNLKLKYGVKVIFTGDQLLKYNNKNRTQSKYLKNDDVHLSNKQITEKWSKKK